MTEGGENTGGENTGQHGGRAAPPDASLFLEATLDDDEQMLMDTHMPRQFQVLHPSIENHYIMFTGSEMSLRKAMLDIYSWSIWCQKAFT